MEYSIVVPIFNEEGNIRNVYNRLSKVMKNLHKPYEIIFVDDGSTDKSVEILKDIHSKDSNIKVILLTRNFGQHAALMAAFDITRGKKIITIDADLQMLPEDIPKLINKMNEGYDVVFGIYNKNRKDSFFRRIGSNFAKYVLSKIIPVNTTDLSGFRILKSHTIVQLKKLNEKSKMIDGLLCWMGYKIGKVEIQHNKRLIGTSKYNIFKLINFWLDMVVSLTFMPLKISIFGGILIGIIGFLLASYYIIRYLLFGTAVQGFTTLTILITVFSGVQLFCLGIIGEYLGRTNREVMNKPEYIIKEIL